MHTIFTRTVFRRLKQWKEAPERKPLILRGARQVGKTSAVKRFAEEYFEDVVYINLERAEDWEAFHDIRSLCDFERTVRVVLGKALTPGKTLVFLDEIQHAPGLIELLRFFYEERPTLHVVAAGSLLEVMLLREGLEMPVGRVEYARMYPMTFFEFLGAMGKVDLLHYLENVRADDAIPAGIHREASELFRTYALVGGMPEAVSLHSRGCSPEEMHSLYASLLTGYMEDIYKYARSADVKYVRHILEHAPYAAGERITYEKFGNSAYRSREMGEAFDLLGRAMLISQVFATKSRQLPIVGRTKASKKLLFLDAGLVNFKNGIEEEFVRFEDVGDMYRGKLAEQIVGQNLLALGTFVEKPLFYWAKDASEGSAEVDFCLSHRGRMVGIEVKSGHAGRLKSLASLKDAAPEAVLMRISSAPLARERVRSFSKRSEEYAVLSLPFYLVNRVGDFLENV